MIAKLVIAPGTTRRQPFATMERPMAKLRLLTTGHGDLCLAEWDPKRPATIEPAESAFADHFTSVRISLRLYGPGKSRPIQRFGATATESPIVPAMQGGS